LDIAKRVFQVYAADGAGHVLFRKRITRVKLLSFPAAQTRCVVAIEVSHGRYVTFQMAEVAVLRQMFADILLLIARLRAPPAPA
jgi:hypothetical protein